MGAVDLPAPVRRLSVPPLTSLAGQRHGSVACGGAAGRFPLPFPLSSSAFCGAVPMPSYYPSSFRVVVFAEVTLDFLPRVRWSLLYLPLSVFPAVCSWSGALGVVASGLRSVPGVGFRPIHGPVGFPSGLGFGFCHPPLAGCPHA